MSFEIGGRSDKQGNQYENRFLATLLLRLAREELRSIEVEPLGAEEDGVEYITVDQDGNRAYYQCKGSNGMNAHWRFSDLEGYDVFSRSLLHVERSLENTYHFISPLPYDELDSLCARARTVSSCKDFVNYQLSNKKLLGWWKKINSHLNVGEERCFSLLAHSYYELKPTGEEARKELEDLIDILFSGEPSTVRLLLEQFAHDEQRWGVSLTAQDVLRFLEEKDVHFRNLAYDTRCLPRIQELNTLFSSFFRPIDHQLFHRIETDEIVAALWEGHSVLLTGRAGTGKSGCIQELLQVLETQQIPYLAIKLDKHPPNGTTEQYGKTLGFLDSPVLNLHRVAGGKPCVLLFDQLDSLRWVDQITSTALAVCKQMIAQIKLLNRTEDAQIRCIFVSRTFDYETDPGLRELFERNDEGGLDWKRIEVGLLDDIAVKQIVGDRYDSLQLRLKKLLRIPANLYIWMQLAAEAQNSVLTLDQMMQQWWMQLLEQCAARGLERARVDKCRGLLVRYMGEMSQFSLPVRLFSQYSRELDVLVSGGMLVKTQQAVSFVHQSMLDSFLVSDYISQLYEGNHLDELIGVLDRQTPDLRYRFLMVLQTLQESGDLRMLLQECKVVLDSANVRHYFKCGVFEVIGQVENPQNVIWSFLKPYFDDPIWRAYILQTVFACHPQMVELLMKWDNTFTWHQDEGLFLLRSISECAPDQVVAFLSKQSQELFTPRIQYSVLCYSAMSDSEQMFALRLHLLEQDLTLLQDDWSIYDLIHKGSRRALPLLRCFVDYWIPGREIGHISHPDGKWIQPYVEQHARETVEILFEPICQTTAGFIDDYDSAYREWSELSFSPTFCRYLVALVQAALSHLAKYEPEYVLPIIVERERTCSLIEQELLLHTIEHMPLNYADDILSWLLRDFERNAFEYTSREKTALSCCMRIIERFSKVCSEEMLRKLEDTICCWSLPAEKMRERYKWRRELSSNTGAAPVYHAYWGQVQKMLLPSIEPTRRSQYTEQLIGVLERNAWVPRESFALLRGGMAKHVISPIAGRENRLSNKRWLEIMKNGARFRQHVTCGETANAYIEASVFSFTQSFGVAVKKEPVRFAQLALQIPLNAQTGFIDRAIDGLQDKQVPLELVCEVVRRFKEIQEHNVAMAIARLIETRAEENWPEDILGLLSFLAAEHSDPLPNEFIIKDVDTPELIRCESLLQSSHNCVRGCAVRAITNLLWEHTDYAALFFSTMLKVAEDPNPAVRYAAVDCAVAWYNIDTAVSEQLLRRLLDQDLRALGTHSVWQLVQRFYRSDPLYYRAKLVEACQSEINDLAESAAKILCAVTILVKAQVDELFELSLNEEQADAICQQAAICFDLDEYHDVSTEILKRLIALNNDMSECARLFYDCKFDIVRDGDFLVMLMSHCKNSQLIHAFMSYLKDQEGDISAYAEVISALGKSLVSVKDGSSRWCLNDLIQCVTRLLQDCMEDEGKCRLCLELWDDLFRSDPHTLRKLSETMANIG